MSWLSSLRSRALAVFARERVSAELREELQSHMAHRADDLEREGMSRAEAERQARVEFGGYERIREETHAARGAHWLETVLWDVRFGVRMLAKARGFTAVALLTLMLGVGASTAVFSLIDALLLRPLPVPHASQLVALAFHRSDYSKTEYSSCTPFIRGLEKQRKVFRYVAASSDFRPMLVRGKSGSVNVPAAMVSGEYFEALGVKPLLGRYLTPQDDRKGGGPNGFGVVISEGFWREWFHRSPHVIGKTLTIANHPFTVVGVMPKSFIGADPTTRPQIYAPLWAEPVIDAPFNLIRHGVGTWWLTVFARRNPGMSLQKTNAALAAVSDQVLRSEVTDTGWIKDAMRHHFRFVAEPGSTGFSYLQLKFKKPLLVVFVLCLALLLLACLNLASLLLARATARERELATRLAIGASRGRLIQQLLVESLLVAVAGSVLGVAASPLLSHALAALLMGNNGSPLAMNPIVLDPSLDIRVLVFSTLTAFFATLVIGVVPALRATSRELNEQIKGGTHASSKRSRRRIVLRPLMSLEVVLGLIILVGAGLLTASLLRLHGTGLGFQPDGLVNLTLNMDQQPLQGPTLLRWYQRYDEALGALPGVKGVSFQSYIPLSTASWTWGFSRNPQGRGKPVYANWVAPEYFRTMRIPVHAGRRFGWSDTLPAGNKVILNEKAAKEFFGTKNPVGRRIYAWGDKKPYEVIGVVGDVIYDTIQKGAPATAYVPITQNTEKKPSYEVVLRVDGPLQPLAAAVRDLTARMAPEIPAPVMTTEDEVLNNSIRSERMMAMLSLFFAGCALLITGIGLYGTLAYMTAQRTSEIGIRMALGAQRWQVVRLVLMENAWIAVVGMVAGVGAALLLGLVACAASLAPAVRAARIDPMEAIRCE